MQFQVPQFIDMEDKIFGPLSFKQFLYIGGGAALAYILYANLPFIIAVPLMGAVAGLSGALAFIEINKRPFISMMESAFMYIIRGRLFLWKADRKTTTSNKQNTTDKEPEALVELPSLAENKLANLAWSLDINERLHVDRSHEQKIQEVV